MKKHRIAFLVFLAVALFVHADITFQADVDGWKALDLSDLAVAPGSALDLSAWNDAPAGKHGRVVAMADGQLAFANAPNTPVRFFGFNWITGAGLDVKGPQEKIHQSIADYAKMVRRQGYNAIRTHCLDVFLMEGCQENGVFSNERLALFDDIFSAFKNEGIYVYLDLSMYGWAKDGWNGRKFNYREKIFFNEENAREIWKTAVTRLLAHRNPHTGLTYAEDPAVLAVLFSNEQDLALFPPSVNIPPSELVQKGLRNFLKQKYGTCQALANAWKRNDLKDFSDVKIPHTSRIPPGQMRADVSAFYLALMDDMTAFYTDVLKRTGYQGLYVNWDAAKNVRSTLARRDYPLICSHDYFAHPSRWMSKGSRQNAGSSLDQLWYFRTMAQMRLANRPFMITEYAHGFWNQYGHEAGIAISAYSALQNYSGLMAHCNAVLPFAPTPMSDFHQSKTPVFRANEFIAAHFFRRGDVRPAQRRLTIPLPLKEDDTDGSREGATNAEQTKFAFILGFNVDFRKNAKDNIVEAWERSETVSTQWTNTFATTSGSTKNLDAQLKVLKDAKLVEAANRSIPSKGIFESATGQILLDTAAKTIRVTTDFSEAIVLKDTKPQTLKNIASVSSDIPAATAIIAIDGKPLCQSTHLVVCYATQAANSDMTISDDRSTMVSQGHLPLLVKSGTLSMELALQGNFTAYALDIRGNRQCALPVTRRNGRLCLNINTATLPQPTAFFELVIP